MRWVEINPAVHARIWACAGNVVDNQCAHLLRDLRVFCICSVCAVLKTNGYVVPKTNWNILGPVQERATEVVHASKFRDDFARDEGMQDKRM